MKTKRSPVASDSFRSEKGTYVCRYCSESFDTPSAEKDHLEAEHSGEMIPEREEVKTLIKGLSFLGFCGGTPIAVDVKDGRILRIRPFRYDEKYTRDHIRPWKIEARGVAFEPPLKSLPSWLSLSYKGRVYSPNRILYPLRRTDWDPNGERHPENRGKSKYKRISWDEATTLIANEIKRVTKKYGPYAILHQGDGHGESKTVHSAHGCPMPLLAAMGGFTKQVRNPDSWEGHWWGTKHVWGNGWFGMMAPTTNCEKDVAEHTEMILFWGSDTETTYPTFADMISSRELNWYTELGIKCVYICPDLNYSAAVHADKWIPVLPNTDAALQLAIAYLWITEETYDKDYVATHTVGFEKFQDYVLGAEDKIPKTPAWASPLCGVPEWTIKALAREWASKTTSTHHSCGGSAIRGPYSTEPARLEALLLAMQGLGKPGVHQLNGLKGWPRPEKAPNMFPAMRGMPPLPTLPKQHIAKPLIPKAILDPPISWYSTTSFEMPVEDQFVQYHYPVEGCSEVHMIWSDSPCWTVCWNGGNQFIEALKSEKIECVVVQHPWLENDTLFADIILPINTKFEEQDIGAGGTGCTALYLEEQCIEPLGESKSDYEAVAEVAKKLGMYEQYTGGKSVEEWIRFGYEASGIADLTSWDELKEKGYFVVPTRPDWKKDPPGWRRFYEDPEKYPLETPSGKIEFYSERLAEHFPNDEERPPSPHWIPEGETHQESKLSKRSKEYPLLIVSNHPRWREHAMHDDVSWLREIPTCKVKGCDGYLYEPVWMHPIVAAERGINSGDIVKIFNERGAVLGGAYVTERIIPGVVYQDHGARIDLITDKLDRGGSNNLIAPTNVVSKNCTGMATSGYLVQLERVGLAQLEEWMRKHPEVFKRDYDPAYGLVFSDWVES